MNLFQNINKVCKDKNISHSEFRVYMVLISYNSNRKIYPSLDTIAKDSGIKSIPDISKKLHNLEERGYIEIKRRKHQSNIYRIKDIKEPSIKENVTKPKTDAEPEPQKSGEIKPEHKPLTQEQKEKSMLLSVVIIYASIFKRKYESGDFAIIKKLLKLKESDNICYTVKCLMLLHVIQSVKDKISENNFHGILFNQYRESTTSDLKRIFQKPEPMNYLIPNSNNIPFTKIKKSI